MTTEKIQSMTLEQQVAAYNAAKKAVDNIYELYHLTGGLSQGGIMAANRGDLFAVRDAIRRELEASKQVEFDDEEDASLTNRLPEIC